MTEHEQLALSNAGVIFWACVALVLWVRLVLARERLRAVESVVMLMLVPVDGGERLRLIFDALRILRGELEPIRTRETR